MPVALPFFTGRQELLNDLKERCFSNPWNSERPSLLLHLHGFAGLGKSETAIFFANAHLDKISLVWRIRCDEAWYEIDYRSLAKALNIPLEKETLEQVVDKVHTKLSMHSLDKSWMILLDGIEKRVPFPERGGIVLSTSQTEKLWQEQETIPIKPFNLEQTRYFFTNAPFEKRITNLEGLESLHESLQGWPILLSNAYTYILDTGGTIRDYIQELESIEPLYKKEETSKYPHSLAKAFELTLRRLANPESIRLLFCCAYLNPNEIHFSIFEKWKKGSSLRWRKEVIHQLENLSIIRCQNDTFSLHGLWQSFLKQKLMKDKQAEQYFRETVGLIKQAGEGFSYEKQETWDRGRICTQHLGILKVNDNWQILEGEEGLLILNIAGT